ncbi:LysR family transcriptional regulator [Methylocella sp. CPCC 101449]|uniref:LysR family transcriptional regulator n=1 Tax=Methylocella sp. CPCC 101449 TaxID=2987531 RepID=UPI00289284F8|nr:LysR family transcriptional regulator [Methylocella sp. CPCC 101449]MDT2022158.1 LysR family transcriptional regulator [Methylocella sp. CPCC 101449]
MLHARMLSYLDEVARCGSIRKAAANLNVASTAINRQIIALEQELGEPLFERMPRRLRLTAAGEVLIEHVRETLKSYDRTRGRLDALKGTKQGHVSIATTLGLAAGPIAKIIHEYTQEHPHVRIVLQGLFADGIPNAVISGDVDLGLGFNLQRNAKLKTLFGLDVPFGAVVAPSHPLAQREKVRLSEAATYPLVLAEQRMSLRALVDLALARVSVTPRPIVETNSIELMKQYVHLGQAVTFLNPLDVAEDRLAGRLRYLPIGETLTQSMTLIARHRGTIDPATSRFVEHLKRSLTQLTESYA